MDQFYGARSPVCAEYFVPLTNLKGWADLNSRARLMERMRRREEEGKRCVLLCCCDLDPGGVRITDFLRQNLIDLSGAVRWNPERLEIVRFGLNADFVRRHRLTWIDNLETSSGRSLADPEHADSEKDYVQNYLKKYGARKVEANALIVRPDAGRELCRSAIEKYVTKSDVDRYLARLRRARAEVRKLLPGAARGFAKSLTRGKSR